MLHALGAFVCFCALSSAGYLLNDVVDVEADRAHPTKRFRPIAAGQMPIGFALGLGVALAFLGMAGAFRINLLLGVLALAYVLLTAVYSMTLKHIVLLDIFGLAGGFVLRAAAGAVAIDVPISPWLYIATLLGALLIALGKRRTELETLGVEAAVGHRRNLEAYSIEFIDQLILVISSAALMTYALYTFSAENLPQNHSMMLTIPVVHVRPVPLPVPGARRRHGRGARRPAVQRPPAARGGSRVGAAGGHDRCTSGAERTTDRHDAVSRALSPQPTAAQAAVHMAAASHRSVPDHVAASAPSSTAKGGSTAPKREAEGGPAECAAAPGELPRPSIARAPRVLLVCARPDVPEGREVAGAQPGCQLEGQGRHEQQRRRLDARVDQAEQRARQQVRAAHCRRCAGRTHDARRQHQRHARAQHASSGEIRQRLTWLANRQLAKTEQPRTRAAGERPVA